MREVAAKHVIQKLIQSAGINIDGDNPWDIQVYNNDFYARVLSDKSLGLGEAYMEKWWDCQRLDILFDKMLRAKLDTTFKPSLNFYLRILLAKIYNFQSRQRSKKVAEIHYDLGNHLFEAMLDSRMIYSCAYWKNATTLDEAQLAKLDLICRKLQLESGMHILDIGCGWGGFAAYAAEKYAVKVTGITISENQLKYAQQHHKHPLIEFRLQDYRDINEKFDRIVSIGMFEHVGHPNYAIFFKKVASLLTDDGIFLLHTIGLNQTGSFADDWTIKYIFPNGMLPSVSQIGSTSEKYFVIEDLHNIGAHYDQTLMAWHANFTKHWDALKQDYDDKFYRMWTYYLLSSAGSFRARSNQLWQFVLTKNGLVGGYQAPR